MKYLDELNKLLTNFLQCNIRITHAGSFYKEGKLLLYNFNNYILTFQIKNYKKNKIDHIKLPIPFKFEDHVEDNLLYFDYRIKNFYKTNTKIGEIITNLKRTHKHRFYNKIVEIEVINDGKR